MSKYSEKVQRRRLTKEVTEPEDEFSSIPEIIIREYLRGRAGRKVGVSQDLRIEVHPKTISLILRDGVSVLAPQLTPQCAASLGDLSRRVSSGEKDIAVTLTCVPTGGMITAYVRKISEKGAQEFSSDIMYIMLVEIAIDDAGTFLDRKWLRSHDAIRADVRTRNPIVESALKQLLKMIPKRPRCVTYTIRDPDKIPEKTSVSLPANGSPQRRAGQKVNDRQKTKVGFSQP